LRSHFIGIHALTQAERNAETFRQKGFKCRSETIFQPGSQQTIYLRRQRSCWPIKMAIIIIVMYQAMGRYGNQRQRP